MPPVLDKFALAVSNAVTDLMIQGLLKVILQF